MSILLEIFLFLLSLLLLEIIILIAIGFVQGRSLSLWTPKTNRAKHPYQKPQISTEENSTSGCDSSGEVLDDLRSRQSERTEKMKEGFCPIHGPYDASLGACPYPHDSQSRPTSPGIDNEGEEETELGHAVRDDVTELEVTTGGGPLAMLWVKEGPRRGKFYPIRHGAVIGRNEGNLILDDPKVSGSHAKFTMEKNDFFVWDLGSANGTYVNGKRIREATLLYENDHIKIGDTIFVVKLLEQHTRDTGPNKKRRSTESIQDTKEIDSIKEMEPIKPPKDTKRFRVSIAYPLCLAKRFASVFLFHFYLPLPKYRTDVDKAIKSEFQGQKLGIPIDHVSLIQTGQKVKVRLSNPSFSFSDSGIKVVDDPVNKITFLVMPSESCEPGSHKILVSISDAETDHEFESITINVQVVDFAFDHVSRPLFSRVSAVVLGIGSFAMFTPTFLEQIDKTVGLTSGAAAGALALGIYASFYNLYQRVRPNTP
jgi:hypothetical protein